ncbi:uncharacterized protein B0P05DRAFT_614908 [Gilbertella persicaria]|uniref:Uncharacterized protein n=1 Tax=Rhizopus stolonifer TaxID=4846 RepID=A0A367KRI6_RHIST|nr:uncharacterized protein B0P05DRAFT_614908 [Gilbertella persicaria]KAI8078282.1 hypothetical protein B0P05DRAFT_614908 [Gilbertella persicaria]RCI04818.1 hypothetical protein CU098_011580 [Rhizopus stolonifer]
MGIFRFLESFASIFIFFAIILELFTLLSNTYNKPFLNDLYIVRLIQNSTTDFIDLGLWNACNGTANQVLSCDYPQPAFVWTNATGLDKFTSDTFDGYPPVFLANFIIYWIGFGLTLLAFVFSVMTHSHRFKYTSVAMITFFAFVFMLVAFCIMIVMGARIANTAFSNDTSNYSHIGPATWMTLGAMAGLLYATVYYCCSCFFRPKNMPRYSSI